MERELYAAATSGDSKALALRNEDLAQKFTPTGNTALHLAAYHGQLEVVQKLVQMMNGDIERHGSVSGTNNEGNTALHEAAMGGHKNVVHFLRSHGDLVNIVNLAGETALFKAAEEGYKEIVEELLPLTDSQYDKRTSDGQTLAQCAVYKTHKGVLKTLADSSGRNILQQVDNFGRTPLHSAAYLRGVSPIAKILLDKHRSLCYEVDKNHQTALHLAVKEGNLELATEIIKSAEDCIEIVDGDGRTALHLVVENAEQTFRRISRSIKTLVVLVISRRLINKPDNMGKTALDIAMEKMGTDERLFYGIKRLLERNGARRSARAVEETREHSSATDKSKNSDVQLVSVNAVLIATVAFAAAFTLPKDEPKYTRFFQMTVICDALAFCISISSAILLMYALDGKQEDPLLLNTSITGLWIALISLLLAFGTAIFDVVAKEHKAVAGTVLGLVSIVPICIRIMIFRSKKYIFREDEHHLWSLVIVCCLQVILVVTLATKDKITAWQALCIVVGLMVVWIAASLGPLLSRKRISKDNGHYIWFLVIGAITNLIFISFLIFVLYLTVIDD